MKMLQKMWSIEATMENLSNKMSENLGKIKAYQDELVVKMFHVNEMERTCELMNLIHELQVKNSAMQIEFDALSYQLVDLQGEWLGLI